MVAKTMLVLVLSAACIAASTAALGQAGDFPSRAVRIIVPFPPGGSVDIVARTIGHELAEAAGQQVMVENRAGVLGSIGAELVARAAADGHTLLMANNPLVVRPTLFDRLSFNILRDFTPVSLVAAAPFVLVLHPSLPVASVEKLIAYAKARPGELNYASARRGSNLHIAAELFKRLAGVDIVRVPYRSGSPALTALISGEAQVGFLAVVAVHAHVKAGRMRALGVTSAQRSVVLPEVPTIAEAGVPDYEFSSWYGVLAPVGTPADRVAALNGHLRNATYQSDVARRLTKQGAEIIISSPEDFARHLRAEQVNWAKVAAESGLKSRTPADR